jgi:L-alanine-DL-glutamate epimerase-like enolase superfamily enzyme
LVTVQIETDSGETGLGYTYTVGRTGAKAVFSLIADDLKDALIGVDVDRHEWLWNQLWWKTHFVGRGGLSAFAIAAIDVALWDLRAKVSGKPLWRYLGGADPEVMAYAGGIDLQFTTDALIEQADGFLGAGFRAIKMKAGRDRLSEDVERVARMRAHLGDDFPLLADANMRWSVAQAIRAARSFEPYGLYWLEEPTIPDDVDGLRRIAEASNVPIATGENLHSLYEFEMLIARGGVAYPEPDAATLGGITPWLKVARLAEANNLPVTSHGVHDIHVHLLAAVPNASFLEVHGFGLERFIEEPLTLDEGVAHAPERPGHGIAFDFAAMESIRVASG